MDQDKHRKVLLTGAERAKAYRDHRRCQRESACQRSISIVAAAAAELLMELRVEMRSDDTDMDMN
jgi:hypothetical protein